MTVKRTTRWLKRGALLSCVLGALAVAAAIGLCAKPTLYGDTPFSTAIADRDGEMLRLTLADDERYRLKVAIDDIAPAAIEATLLYEDRHFYRHPGFNPAALLRGAWVTYVTKQRVMGGSTITMQLARMRFGIDSRTLSGKLVQIARAVQLERHYSKREILEAYLNWAPYGGNVEGLGTAALVYFGKPAAELSLPEALALAVIPQNPAARIPAHGSGYLETLAARERLFELWQDRHGLTDTLRAQFDMPIAVQSASDLPFEAPHFAARVAATASAGIHRSTLDLSLQRMLEGHVEEHAERHRSIGVNNASAMLVDARSMQLLASVGSADFFDARLQGQVDGTLAKRSPGSTLKPFIYGLAIDAGLIHPLTMLKDAPRRFAAYTPENFDQGFMGPVFARDALALSRNVPAADLLTRVGPATFNEFLGNAKVTDLRDARFYGLAAVLGGIELTMHELVALYAMLANDGVLRPVNDALEGNDAQGVRLLSAESAFLVRDMLRANPRPGAIDGTNNAIPWKTGTSFAFRDAWSIGLVGDYVLAVWVGNFDGSSNPAFVGREAAAPLFFAIADTLVAARTVDLSVDEPSPAMNLRKVEVCARTGDLPGRHCPHTVPSWFIPGVSPIQVSNVHRPVHVDTSTGLRTCRPEAGRTETEIFEFWPSDITRLFRKAGVAVRQPPPWAPECSVDVQAASGLPPRIDSLSEKLTYPLRGSQPTELPLNAATDADVEFVYWFVDQHYLGRARRDESLAWRASAGKHRVLAVDDRGRSDAMQVVVSAAP